MFAKLRRLGIPPSEPCSEEAFLRRVCVDVIGTLPKPDEARAYLADPDPAKRGKFIDRLLERDEYADYWALKWGDLLRIKSEYPVRVWPRGVLAYHRWVRDSIAANKPYDQFVRELITANGSDFRMGPSNYYRAVQQREPQTYAEATAVLFLGARLECARCHGHPRRTGARTTPWAWRPSSARWPSSRRRNGRRRSSTSIRSMAACTTRGRASTSTRNSSAATCWRCPRDQDPRPRFADWLTAPQNPWFARVMANRVWYWLLGRGIVHEPDDFRPTNPPSNPELLDYLAQEFVEHQFDVKHLFRLILNSRAYQLSSKANELNRGDAAHFSHYRVRRLAAEQLLDAVCQITGAPDQFASWIPVPPTILPIGFPGGAGVRRRHQEPAAGPVRPSAARHVV